MLGSTADALQGLGARENDIFMRGSKINLILKEHPEMTMEEIKRIPEILDDPILVLSSRNKGRAGSQNTRLVLFGSVKAQDGRPVLCVLDLQPVENRIVIRDMQKATSAYTKDNDPVGFVRNSEVLYTSENEKRTTALLRTLGFQMPSELQRYGSIGSITYADGGVKFAGVPFTEIEASSGSLLASDDAGQIKQKQESADTVLKTEEGGERPSFPTKNSIAQENAESKKNTAALKTESAAEGRSMRFSIQKDADGESYIKIDEDILNGVPQEDWKTVVKQAIKERYPNGFERNGWTILNLKEEKTNLSGRNLQKHYNGKMPRCTQTKCGWLQILMKLFNRPMKCIGKHRSTSIKELKLSIVGKLQFKSAKIFMGQM